MMKQKMVFSLLMSCMLVAAHALHAQSTYPSSFTVAQDGSGNFKTIQEAIFAARDLSQQQVTIHIKNGVYNEKLIIPSWKTNITLLGESRDGTIITYNDHAGKRLATRDEFLKTDSLRTFTSYTVLVEGNDCRIENLTIKNTSGRVGQGVALHVEGDRFVAKGCTLIGNQDTLYAATESRQFYDNCYIEGTTDFIFGEATCVFRRCTLKNLVNSFIAAPSTRPGTKYGFVFLDCTLIADTSVTKAFLGRPWRPYGKAVYINANMGKHIAKEGWDNWRNPAQEKTAVFAEYKSYGEGADAAGRVKWAKQLTAKEAKQYTLEKIFEGKSNWVPK
jgi:pectinesterase